jgi:hypothetical protein
MTNIIKKKYNWSISSGPNKPFLRKEPSKTKIKKIPICESYELLFQDIKIPQEYLNKGYSIENLSFTASSSYDDSSKVIVELLTQAPDENYEKDLISYKKEKEVHKVELLVWQKENEQYELWKKQEEDKLLQKRLDTAQKLLKKYGKI